MYFVAIFVNYLTQILIVLILIRVILSWFRGSQINNKLSNFIIQSTDPIMNLAKKITPRLGPIDISPIVAVMGLEIMREVIFYIISQI
ncbi:MAG: hypothetical protein UV80_C0002G0331 [Candidatus Peregrinibacteria bacterium GW2011_GWF2_43_17]|nr:MAG: hypothetical protein UV80_C0002G0331 [Candidatus Peregrinibacteria bacterium GW2011_GWF2_43_17]HAU39628.1 hypothetical protein [Candidatus Peregrinibacteria bacterium]